MTDLPDIKIKTITNFPSNALGGTGIEVDKTNGNYVIGLDYSEFAFSGTLPPNTNTLVWDPVTDTYILVPPSAVGGISDAPSDSQTYGRNNAAWVPVPGGGGGGSGDVVGPDGAVADRIAVFNGTTGKIIKDGGALISDLALLTQTREKLTAARNYYVRIDGSDANNGLTNTAGGAFLTLQKAADTIWNTIDTRGFTVTVNIANGTFGRIWLTGMNVGGGLIQFIGNVSTPASVVLNNVSDGGDAVVLRNGAIISLSGVKFATAGMGVSVFTSSVLSLSAFEMGACLAHFVVEDQGIVNINGNYTISGAAAWHCHLRHGGFLYAHNGVATVVGTPAFTYYFWGMSENAIADFKDFTFAGAATGQRHNIHSGSVVKTARGSYEVNFFPGSTAGSLGGNGVFEDFTGTTNIAATNNSSTPANGALVVAGGIGVAGKSTFGANVGFNTDPDTAPGVSNTAVGALILAGSGQVAFSSASGPTIFGNVNADGVLMSCKRGGNDVGSIVVSTTGTAFNTTSDARLKEDLKAFDAGSIVDNINVYDFKWKSTGERSYGIIAQQAVKVYPTAVTHNVREDWWGVDYSKYVPVLLQELKALRARVAALEAGGV